MTILATAGVSTGLAYAITTARIGREEEAKHRSQERRKLPQLFGQWIEEAEGIRRALLSHSVLNPIEHLQQSYVQCSGILDATRWLSNWELWLVKRFCVIAFGREVYDLAMRMSPPDDNDPIDDLIDYKLVWGTEEYPAKFRQAEFVLSMFEHGAKSNSGNLRVPTGVVTLMRIGEQEGDREAAMRLASTLIKLSVRMQRPRIRHVPLGLLEATIMRLRAYLVREYSLSSAGRIWKDRPFKPIGWIGQRIRDHRGD